MSRRTVDVTPSAARLTSSLRDIGYDFATAIADLVDNSVSAGATEISLDFEFAGSNSHIRITDNGRGMTPTQLDEAMRFGTRRSYGQADLGRFGLGLKTASLSQARRLTVVTRRASTRHVTHARTLDLDHVVATDSWRVFTPAAAGVVRAARAELANGPGTVVVLQKPDRLFEGVDPSTGWARRRLEKLIEEAAAYLGMVFHRFIEGSAEGPRVSIVVAGEKIRPWNPFAPDEERTRALPIQKLTVQAASGRNHPIVFRPFVLPGRAQFSTQAEFERLGGPRRWNRQQGLYIYRADRMVQSGGWCGLRAADEHTKLARAVIDFPTALDEEFKVDVAKMKVTLPASAKEALRRPINEMCALADDAYRSAGGKRQDGRELVAKVAPSNGRRAPRDLNALGMSLHVAAALVDESEALERILAELRVHDPDAAVALGTNL